MKGDRRQPGPLGEDAGADRDAIPAWIETGRAGRDNAKLPPFSGGLR